MKDMETTGEASSPKKRTSSTSKHTLHFLCTGTGTYFMYVFLSTCIQIRIPLPSQQKLFEKVPLHNQRATVPYTYVHRMVPWYRYVD
jgi:hypothetical protein